MTANAQGLSRQFLELRSKETTLTADIAGREADVRGIMESMEASVSRLVELEGDLSSGQGRKAQAQANLDAVRKDLNRAQENVTAAKNTITGYGLRQAARIKRRDELAEQLRAIVNQMNSVSAKAKVFRAMERDFESYQKSVRLVMQEAQRGTLQQIHGPVSRLIRTDDAYTVAIEIALGGALQQGVVDHEQAAKAAMAFLKRTGGGRATFLPLTTSSPGT